MAVVFISPKKRQKKFVIIILVVVLLVLAGVGIAVFWAQPKAPPASVVFNKPKVSLNMDVFNSDQFKQLQLFTEIKMQFAYTAKTSENEQKSGVIEAASEADAREILQGMGLVVLDIKQAGTGRENPFTPY